MNRLIILIFSFLASYISIAQDCSINVMNSNSCISSQANGSLLLQALVNGASVSWEVDVIDAPPSGINNPGIVGNNDLMYAVEFDEPGTYLVTMTTDNGCEPVSHQIEVFEATSFTVTLLPDYYICNGNTSVQFKVNDAPDQCPLNGDDCVTWIGTNIGDHVEPVDNNHIFSINFDQPSLNESVSIEVEDENGCIFIEDYTFNINDGPSESNVDINILNGLSCVSVIK